jgi:hypothetical protein
MRSWPIPDNAEEIPALITIQRGLTTLRWNTSSRDVTIGSDTWPAIAGAAITSFAFASDGTESNADVQIMTEVGGLVEPGDGARGILDGWPISVKLFDPADPAGTAVEIVPGSIVGSVAEDTNGIATIAASGQLVKAGVYVTEHYSLSGREDLGDDRCKVPIMPADIGRGVAFVRPDTLPLLHVNDAYGRMRTGVAGTPVDYANVYFECTTAGTTAATAPTYDPTIGNSTTDGTAVFIARNAWTRHATGQATGTFVVTLDALPDSRASDPTWYVLGALYVRSGNLSGYPKIPIRAWNPATLEVTLFLPVLEADIPAGTQLEIQVGCDLTREMCFARFNNIINLRAETFVPPPDVNF